MPTVPRAPLSEFFGLFAPTYFLGTTFTLSLAFFEGLVLPHVRRTNLRRCLLISDRTGFRQATIEAGALRSAGRDYMTVCAPCRSSFHAKVWLMVGPGEAALLVGSGNLTQSGFMANAELFDVVHLKAGGPHRAVALSLCEFLMGLIGLWGGASPRRLLAVETLTLIHREILALADGSRDADAGDVHFLHTFDGPLAEQLARKAPAHTLHVAAPYFGGSTTGLAHLRDRLGAGRVRVFPADHGGGVADVSCASLSALPGTSVHALRLGRRGEARPFAHLKLYGLDGPSGAWLFTTSANCTMAALGGANVEAGLLRRTEPGTVATYFAEDPKAPLPGLLQPPARRDESRWIPLWATDRGATLELATATGVGPRLPLDEARVRLDCGGSVVEVTVGTLFGDGPVSSLNWSDFHGLGGRAVHPTLLRLATRSADGVPVEGAAFVDDYALLASDPAHRGAWRVTLALLAGEGLPDVADLVGIFRLVQDVFDAAEVAHDEADGPGDDGRAARREQPAAREDVPDKIPIWPPTAAPTLAGLLHVAGQVHNLPWFQTILAELLRAELSEDVALGPAVVDPGLGPDVDAGAEGGTEPDDDAPAGSLRSRQALWNHAAASHDRMRRRLTGMEITPRIAPRVWPVAVALFLVTLLTRRHAAGRDDEELALPPVSDLVSAFLGLLFIERPQPGGYHAPEDGRYETGIFPEIAADLKAEFGEAPHRDLAQVLMVLFGYWHAHRHRTRERFPLRAWLLFRDVAPRAASEPPDLSLLRALYEKYLVDESGPLPWDEVSRSLGELTELRWVDHPGYRLLEAVAESMRQPGVGVTPPIDAPESFRDAWPIALRRVRSGKPWWCAVDPLRDHCTAPGCPSYCVADPNLAGLRDQVPQLCRRCGVVLVPERLWNAFRGNHGEDA